MSSSINNSTFTDQLKQMLKSFVQEKLELIMREELENFLNVETPDVPNSKNGYYQRSLDTKYGKIEKLSVPRDSQGSFKPNCLLRISVKMGGWKKQLSKCTKAG
jgi:putative transposase